MHAKRIVSLVVVKDGWVVQSIGFNRYLPVGHPEIVCEFLNQWGIDEIILVDISARARAAGPDVAMVKSISKKIFVPLTVGGGIRHLDDIHGLIHSGADKVAMNTAAVSQPKLIREAADMFGNQCVVICIDYRKESSENVVYISNAKEKTRQTVTAWAKNAIQYGAGEILLNSIDRDGSKNGFDTDLAAKVVESISAPVITCGGAGHPNHFLDVFLKANPSAAAAGNFFHFTEHSPILVKSFLNQNGIQVRLDTKATYQDSSFDIAGRISKRREDYLEKLRFEFIPKEII